jgi:hypothetical protein
MLGCFLFSFSLFVFISISIILLSSSFYTVNGEMGQLSMGQYLRALKNRNLIFLLLLLLLLFRYWPIDSCPISPALAIDSVEI